MTQFDKTPVSEAVAEAIGTPAPVRAKVTPVAIIKFKPKAKVTVARDMDDREIALFARGEELGYATVESDIDWAEVLRSCKSNPDRLILRAGFVSGFTAAGRKTVEQANNRFSYLARLHSPGTSRKGKQGGKRPGAGAPEGDGEPNVEKLSEKAVASRLVAILAYVSQQQRTPTDDAEAILGRVATLANGEA